MKNKVLIIGAIILTALVGTATSIYAGGGTKETIIIQTSAQCEKCEGRITATLKKIDGVEKVKFDEDTKKVTVTYLADKTNPLAIKTAIAKTGYDADDVKADAGAYSNLPGCCHKPGKE